MSLGVTELALILMIVLILFGAGKLPQVLQSLGEGVKKFREAQMEEAPPPSQRDVKQIAPSSPVASRDVAEAEEVNADRHAS